MSVGVVSLQKVKLHWRLPLRTNTLWARERTEEEAGRIQEPHSTGSEVSSADEMM